MRRKRPKLSGQLASSGLLLDAAPVPPVNDPSQPYETRRGLFATFHDEFSEWCERREQWADEHGWPDGDETRINEEDTIMAACGDSPFDPAWEMSNGYL